MCGDKLRQKGGGREERRKKQAVFELGKNMSLEYENEKLGIQLEHFGPRDRNCLLKHECPKRLCQSHLGLAQKLFSLGTAFTITEKLKN